MSRLPQLEQELMRAARRLETGARTARASSDAPAVDKVRPSSTSRLVALRRLPLVAAVAAALLVAAAVAVAAEFLIGTGAPVRPHAGQTFKPTAGLGVPKPGTISLLPLEVADPAGGPPWGMRFYETSRGLGCVQIGRLVGGRLGVLGQDGVFANDGRFHPLPANLIEGFGCAPLDAHGHTFLAASRFPIDASGYQPGGCLPAGDKRLAGSDIAACPSGPWRLVTYGLLGPQGKSITYADGSQSRTIAVVGPQGAYLIVQSTVHAPRGFVPPSIAPALAPIERVTYRDGAVCIIKSARRLGGARGCPPVGYAAPAAQRLTVHELAAPISVRKIPAKTYCAPPNGDDIRPCEASTPRLFRPLTGGPPELLVEISFTSRVAIPDIHSYYVFNLVEPISADGCGGESGLTTADIAAGQRASVRLLVPYRCKGLVRGNVTYIAPTGPTALMPPLPGPGRQAGMVGNFSFRVP
jgi:hypothetical protein